MKYKVGDWVVFKEPLMGIENNDGFILKEVFGKDVVRRIISIDEKFYVVDNYGGNTVKVKHNDLEGVTNIFNKAPSITKRINDKHSILNGLLQTDGSVDLERLVSKLENNSAVHDNVNHPSHYTDGKIEVIDYIEDKKLGYHLGNACKYISRAGKKDAAKRIEDLQKAIWYISRQIELWGKEDKK